MNATSARGPRRWGTPSSVASAGVRLSVCKPLLEYYGLANHAGKPGRLRRLPQVGRSDPIAVWPHSRSFMAPFACCGIFGLLFMLTSLREPGQSQMHVPIVADAQGVAKALFGIDTRRPLTLVIDGQGVVCSRVRGRLTAGEFLALTRHQATLAAARR